MDKPKFNLVYNAEIRNNGTAIYLNHGFQEAGFDVDRFTPTGSVIPEGPFYLYIDDGRDDIDWDLPHPFGYYAIDTHLGFDYRLKQAKKADIVWCAQLSGVRRMQEHGILAKWLPLACSPLAHPTADEMNQRGVPFPKVWNDLVFVGHLQNPALSDRVEFLDSIIKRVPKMWIEFGVFHEDMAATYHTGRLGLNHSIRGDLNMRFFELMSVGVPQLCPRMEGIERLGFKEYKHYIPYDNADEVVEHVRRWPHTKGYAAPSIARAALGMVRYAHTYKHRALQVIEDLKERQIKWQ